MRIKNLPLALLVLTTISCSTSRPADAPAFKTAIDKSRGIVSRVRQQYPGLSVAAAVDGNLVWSEGGGWADLAARKTVTSATRFRTYSSTKWLTAALALRMAEQKRVDLDAPIDTYLPQVPAALSKITLRQLLLHRGGIRHYKEGEWMSVSDAQCRTASEALADFINDPPIAAPGEKFNYSSFGYVLASAVLEAAGKKPFYELLRAEIFDPAGMTSTTSQTEAPPQSTAVAYQRVENEFRVAPAADTSCKFGAGGLVGTAEDLARFGIALSEGRLLSAASLAEMLRGEPTVPGRADYGLGVTLETDDALGRLASHSGGALGGRSFLLIVPDRRLVVALAGNFEGPGAREAAIDIARAFAATRGAS